MKKIVISVMAVFLAGGGCAAFATTLFAGDLTDNKSVSEIQDTIETVIEDERESVNVLYDSDATENEAVDGSGVRATDNGFVKESLINNLVEDKNGEYESKEEITDGFSRTGSFWSYYRDGINYKAEDIVQGTVNNVNGWYYIKDGAADLSFTGFAKNSNGWWYVENGKVTFNKNDVLLGTVRGEGGWWNVKGSKVVFNESIEQNINGWWYVKNGKVDFGYTGFAKNSNGWWYVENGKVTFNKNDVLLGTVRGEGGWWNVKGSKVVFNESIEQNINGWWYVKKGKVDFGYTGFAKNANGWWYVENGKVTFAKNDVLLGTVGGEGGWWNVKDSKVVFNESIEPNKNGWWYIKNGKVQFGYTGVRNNRYGWWYIKGGKVDFSYSGFADNENGKWNIVNGKVEFGITGWKTVSGRDYYIDGGKVAVNTELRLGKLLHTFDYGGRLTESKFTIPKVINQRTTVFGKAGCGGAAALMALQATGYQLNANYSVFWSTVPRAVNGDFRTGYVPGVGITNPAYVNWIKKYAPATRYSGIVASNVLPLIKKGCTVILLVPSGSVTHFVVAYGYNYDSGKYLIADSWGNSYSSYGVTYTLTSEQIDYRLKVAAPRETGTREGIAVGTY